DGGAHRGQEPRGEHRHRCEQHPPRWADRAGVGRSVGMTGEPGARAAEPGRRGVLVGGDVIDDGAGRPQGPTADDSDPRTVVARREGGSAASLACRLAGTGVPVTFVGRVAAADVDRHTAALSAFGVQARLVGDPQEETGTIIILVDETGARTMFT